MLICDRVRPQVLGILLTAAMAVSNGLPAYAQEVHDFQITATDAKRAVHDFGAQAGLQILAAGDNLSGKRFNPISGQLSTEEGLRLMLAGTGLTHRYVGERAIALVNEQAHEVENTSDPSEVRHTSTSAHDGFRFTRVSEANVSSELGGKSQTKLNERVQAARVELEEVVVTGSHIRGAREVASPSITISREEIEAGGYTSVQDIFRELPQNFAEFTPAGAYGQGVSRVAAQNTTDRATGIDLRGLGTQSTLVLLNGKRRAGSASGRAVDVAAIPVSVIERVEVVTGGHSATYGSDAVGGVVNFITRTSFDGMESGASYGFANAGGEYLDVNHIGGLEADRGGLVLAYDYRREQALDALDTGHVAPSLPNGRKTTRFDLQPKGTRHSGYLAGRHELSDGLEVHVDGLFTRKESDSGTHTLYPGAASESFSYTASDADDYSISGGARAKLGGEWTLDVSGTYALVETVARQVSHTDLGYYVDDSSYTLTNDVVTRAASIVVNGDLFTSKLMSARAAIGVERRDERLDYRYSDGSLATGMQGERRVDAAFAELLVDLLPEANIGELQVSLAGRHDDYSDFGSSFNPQAGVTWQFARDWRLRGAYSSAFRAPAFFEYASSGNTGVLVSVPDPVLNNEMRTVLLWGGSDNPTLRPEEADTWSIGVDFAPEAVPGLRLSLSYFDVSYAGRVDLPFYSSVEGQLVLQRESQYAGLIDRTPTPQTVAAILESLDGQPVINNSGAVWDPAAQSLLNAIPDLVVFDRRTANLAQENVSGVDFGGSFTVDTSIGRFTTALNAAYTLNHTRNITRTSPAIEMLDEVGKPVNFRARATLGWALDPIAAYLHIQHVDGYDNPFRTPIGRIHSWTTADLTLRYSPGSSAGSWWSGLDASLSVSNLFDQDPPEFLGDNQRGLLYDAANSHARGRFITLQIRKHWGRW